LSSIDELEDELKHRDRRISDLRGEIDELRDLVGRLRENVEDSASVLARRLEGNLRYGGSRGRLDMETVLGGTP
jgi:hypothetical protein